MVCSCVIPSKCVFAANNILLMRNCNHVKADKETNWFLPAARAYRFPKKIWKQTWWSNDKTVIELGYRKISWFVSDQLFASAFGFSK